MARGKKVRPRAWTERDRQDFRRLVDACGGDRDEFDRRVDGECRRPKRGRKRGRSKDNFFTDFSVSDIAKGLYLVRFRIGGAAPLVCVIVRPQKHRLKPGDPRKTWVELQCEKKKYGKNFQYPTPHQAMHEIVQTLWEAHTKLSPTQTETLRGALLDSVTRRLTSEFRQKVKLLRK
jgi:hypothetical protein